MNYMESYLAETASIATSLDGEAIGAMVDHLIELKERRGRLFIIGNGGSAANASHAVNDFRKICRIEAYTPTDNVAELTARINDDGWNTAFWHWLGVSRITANDVLMVLSVGGGSPTTSTNIVIAIFGALAAKATVLGIVGRGGGVTFAQAQACIVLPTSETPHVEEFQSILLHLIVNHPDLKDAIK